METRFLDNWTTQLRKGILELCVLNAMKGVRLYGYDIVKRLSGIEGLVIAEGLRFSTDRRNRPSATVFNRRSYCALVGCGVSQTTQVRASPEPPDTSNCDLLLDLLLPDSATTAPPPGGCPTRRLSTAICLGVRKGSKTAYAYCLTAPSVMGGSCIAVIVQTQSGATGWTTLMLS